MKPRDITAETDEQLFILSLEKRKNGNGTPRAYAAQREIARRTRPVDKPRAVWYDTYEAVKW